MIPFVVVEVSGGVVQAIYCDEDIDVAVVDWDNIQEGDSAGLYPVELMEDLPQETAAELVKACLLEGD